MKFMEIFAGDHLWQ